ncbi:MAG: hypothetical protein ACT4OZ_09120 [Gemmatimonadota bacterium]
MKILLLERKSKLALLAIAAMGSLAIAGFRAGSSARLPSVQNQIAVGAAWADSVDAAVAGGTVDSSTVLAALYFERHRLGLGSPFRLVEYAVRDQRLPPTARRKVAAAIIARTAQGEMYRSSVEALELLAPDGHSRGAEHRELIDAVTESSNDPRAAELALRLAYQVGAASGSVSHRSWPVALSAIAQSRDRALAMRDARELLRVSRNEKMDPVDLVPTWRAARRFRVESPLVEPPSPEQERTAAAMLPRLIDRLDSLGSDSVVQTVVRPLPVAVALAASGVAAARGAPPQAPVVVTLSGFSSYVVNGARGARARAARRDFVARARDEETLAAEYLLLRAGESASSEAGVTVLAAAVALRTYAQEQAWHIGDAGPAPVELESRLRLASLSFDATVPAAWKTYYTRMFESAVRDIKVIFPALDLSGLHVRFGDSPLRDRALALHDPSTRTMYLPLATSAGALAHELSHDLDWQAARRKYGTTTGYRTDRSVRQYRDGLATTLQRMSATARRDAAGRDGGSTLAGDRPTEAFARRVDWIVATTLAQHGILNGYLSGVQDGWITGYASAHAPRRDAPLGDPTIEALREISPIAPAASRWYDETYGDSRTVGITEGVRRVLLAPSPRWEGPGRARQFSPWSAATMLAHSLGESAWACQLGVPSLRAVDRLALRTAMEATAEARVSGVMERWVAYAREQVRAGAKDHSMRVLADGPWAPEVRRGLERRYRDAMLWRASRVDDGRPGVDLIERVERRLAAGHCASGATH